MKQYIYIYICMRWWTSMLIRVANHFLILSNLSLFLSQTFLSAIVETLIFQAIFQVQISKCNWKCIEIRFKSTEISRPLASGRERTFSEQRRAFESPAWLNRILPYTKRITVAIDPSKAPFLWNPRVIIEWPKNKLKKEHCFWKCNEPERTKDQYIAMIALDWQRFVQDFPVALIGPKLQVNTPNLWKHQQINKLKTQKLRSVMHHYSHKKATTSHKI